MKLTEIQPYQNTTLEERALALAAVDVILWNSAKRPPDRPLYLQDCF